jgi:hypothetical protein
MQASRLTGEETRVSLRRFNWSAGFRSVFDTVGGGTTFVFVAFAHSLGLAGEQMGWMVFLVSCACVLQMLALPVIAHMQVADDWLASTIPAAMSLA